MCFCRRKTSSKDDMESSKKVSNSRKPEQPMPPVQLGPAAPPLNVAPKQENEKGGEKKSRQPKSFPRSRLSKRRKNEDDTISNIPEEMPDLEINREHPEPFYTDEQLM
ncbi:unnamed protein product [Caenorhabditis sp. 36 PRJEB53466]|nr:unnamed protein product [Caenorhabditis sp. 36 PRJEB53466]